MEIQNLPVYKLWLAKPTIEVSRMPPDQYAEAMQKHNEFLAQAGCRELIMADMAWSSEEFESFGIEEFPSLDALIEYTDCLKQYNWFAYLNSKTYLGWSISPEGEPVPFTPPSPPEAGTKPIYKVFLARPTARYYEDPQGMEAVYAKIEEAGKKTGVLSVLGTYSRINNEEWMMFGLERYPNLEAFSEKYWLMEKLGWYRYMQAKSYLGKITGGLLAG